MPAQNDSARAPVKRKGCLISAIVIGAVFLLIIILAIATGGGDENTTDTLPAASTSDNQPSETPPVAIPTETETETESETETQTKTSPLLKYEIHTADVLNGFKTEKIGTRAYISMPKSELKKVTPEQYGEFVDAAVKNSGYNWFTIFLDDNTGICFIGSMGFVADYGKIDAEGAIEKAIGTITLSENGYVYEEN